MPAARHPRPRAGFTLVEAIAAMAVLGLLGGLSGSLLARAVEAYRGVAVQSSLHADLAAALDRADRALREIPSPAGDGVPGISGVTASGIEWDDGAGDASLSLVGGALMLATGGDAPTAILEGVAEFSVQCYDESNAAMAASLSGAACEPIRRVQVTITASRGDATDTIRTRVFLRCTMQGSGG
jgi:prepilin-type N-terminal cleavage/methylation domain-containing protein